MKKLFYSLLFVFVLLLSGCSVYVENMEEKEKSYGRDITFYSFDSSRNMNAYTLIYPESIYGNPKFAIKHYPSVNNPSEFKVDKVQTFENVTVGEIVRENGKIKSIVINGKKYVSK